MSLIVKMMKATMNLILSKTMPILCQVPQSQGESQCVKATNQAWQTIPKKYKVRVKNKYKLLNKRKKIRMKVKVIKATRFRDYS